MSTDPLPPLIDASWQQVDRLPTDFNEDEWDEDEVEYLTLDFGKGLASEALISHGIQLLALNSETPFARIGPTVFRGTHEHLIGSEIFLERDPDTSKYEPWSRTTQSRIRFEQVKLVSRTKYEQGLVNEQGEPINNAQSSQAFRQTRGRSSRPKGRPRMQPGTTRADVAKKQVQEKKKLWVREMQAREHSIEVGSHVMTDEDRQVESNDDDNDDEQHQMT
ncbi:hypothetical protein OIO90_004890 [Microbotryomycetes sp. JL221]|nr:hypothetical protein OIO90_004890 [Microbotryomycetes sp. JL221]